MSAALFLIQVAGVATSLLAGWFWMVSATARPITWQGAGPPIDPAQRAAFQSRWNARAALCAAIAAIAQALVFLPQIHVATQCWP